MYMTKLSNNGSAMLMVVFIIALLSALVIGMLQINTEQLQIMNNQVYAVDALTLAEAGLNNVFSVIRTDSSWAFPVFGNFNGGVYIATISGGLPNRTIEVEAVSAQSYTSNIVAEITIGTSSPYAIRIDELTINEKD